MDIYKKLGIAGLFASIAAIGYAMYIDDKRKKEVDEIKNLFDKTIRHVSGKITVDIPEEILNKAIEDAAEREVGRSIAMAGRDIIRSANRTVEREVNTIVENVRPDISETVTREITKQAAELDAYQLKKEVRERAKEIIVARFEGQLDDIVDEFNKNLSNISKIYSSIAEKMVKKSSETPVFKIEY